MATALDNKVELLSVTDHMQVKEALTADDLECHFTWRPDDDSTKVNLDDVIEKTKKKIEREPHLKVAYLTTLAYLYTRIQVKKLHEASELLRQALDIDQRIRSDKAEDQLISSEFVIRADMLRLKQISRGKKPMTEQEIAEDAADLERLSTLWRDAGNRARAYAVKGATHNCFGPMKYEVGAKAYAEASKLQPDNFHWLYGEAQLRARCDRQNHSKQADDDVLKLWAKARRIGEAKKLPDSAFYSHYAEAILNNTTLTSLCLEMADHSVALLNNLTLKEKEMCHIVYIICLKVYRHMQNRGVNKSELIRKRYDLMLDATTVASSINDPGFYLELSREATSDEGAIELLKKGKELAKAPGHLWIELRLVELQAPVWGKERTVAEYDALRETFAVYNKNVAVIEFQKALFLLRKGEVINAVSSCVYAHQEDPFLAQVKEYEKRDFYKNLKRIVVNSNTFQEYLAWYADNVASSFNSELNIEDLYKAALNKNASNAFALEHLGRFYLKGEKFDLAASWVEKLPDTHESRKKLLAEALLRDPASGIDKLTKCLQLGCKDAAPKVLAILEERKLNEETSRRVMADVLRQPEPTTKKHPLFFDRSVYEVCAQIDVVLQNSGSFFIDKELCDKWQEFKDAIKTKVCDLLELKSLMSKESLHGPTAAASSDRDNLMRSNRFEATKLQLRSEPNQNQIISILKEAKEVLDRSLAVRMHGSAKNFYSYVHAFNQMKGKLDSDVKRSLSEQKSTKAKLHGNSDQKIKGEKASEIDQKTEMNMLVTYLMENKDMVALESVEKHMMLGIKDSNFHSRPDTRDLFNFMVTREHRILSRERCWIIRWIYLVNKEKHATEILVNELNDQLRTDWPEAGDRLTAYDVAHLAAEFAEETWAVFSSGSVGETQQQKVKVSEKKED